MHCKAALLWILTIVLLIILPAAIASPAPLLKSYITDTAGILSPAALAGLEAGLSALEQNTNGVQFLVFIENEFPKDSSLEEYSLKVAEANKVGKKGSDNGLLLYIAVKDRAFRWEVGYGVESTLSASLLGRVSRTYLIPEFQNGQFEKGIKQTVDAVSRILLGSQDADIVSLKKGSQAPKTIFILLPFIIFFFVIIIIVILGIKYPGAVKERKKHDNSFYRGAAAGLFFGGLGRGKGGFGGFSGGFGGFSGGGGGFGGGGFSGRW